MSRCARERDVVFFEEPFYRDVPVPTLEVTRPQSGLLRVIPILPHGTMRQEADSEQARLLENFLNEYGIPSYDLWFYTPMALGFARHLSPIPSFSIAWTISPDFWERHPSSKRSNANCWTVLTWCSPEELACSK
jgi:hypothetical protein